MKRQKKKKGSAKFRAQYGIIVIARDEAHRQHLYTRLVKLLPGVPLKVVCV
jgi:hypothetical protein